jgi:hypothetical protein
VLRLSRKRDRLVLTEVGAVPEPIEQIESQHTPERVFDDLAVALARPGTQRKCS